MTRSYHHGAVRQTVVDAALLLLAEQGPDALTLRLLARKAGVSHTAVGKEFGGFPRVLACCAVAIHARLAEALAAAADHPQPLVAFRAIGVAYIRFAIAHPGWMQFLAHPALAAVADDEAMIAAARGPYEVLLASLRRGIAAGVVRDDAPEELALVAWSAVLGFATLAVSPGLDQLIRPLVEPSDALLDQLYFGFAPTSDAAARADRRGPDGHPPSLWPGPGTPDPERGAR